MKMEQLAAYVQQQTSVWTMYAQMIIGILIDPSEKDVNVMINVSVGGGSWCAYDDVKRTCKIQIGIPEYLAEEDKLFGKIKEFFGDVDENIVELYAKALINHELRHLCYTRAGNVCEEVAKTLLHPRHKGNWEMVQIYKKLLFTLLNAVEDCRIENLLPASALADVKPWFDAINAPDDLIMGEKKPNEPLFTLAHCMMFIMRYGRLPLYKQEISADLREAVMSLHEDKQPNGTTKSWLLAFLNETNAPASVAIFRKFFTIEPFRTYVQNLIADLADQQKAWSKQLKKMVEQAIREILTMGPKGAATQNRPQTQPQGSSLGDSAGSSSETGSEDPQESEKEKEGDSTDGDGDEKDTNKGRNKGGLPQELVDLRDAVRETVQQFVEAAKAAAAAQASVVQPKKKREKQSSSAKVGKEEIKLTHFNPSLPATSEIRLGARKLRKAFEDLKAEVTADDEDCLSSGKLDGHRLYRLPTGDSHVFLKHNHTGEDKDCVFAIAWDGSGSMRGEKQYQSGIACAVIEEALRDLFPLKVINFTVNSSVEHTIVKNFDDNSKKNSAYSFVCTHEFSGGNRDHLAIRCCAEDLAARPEQRKFLFVLSDGLPSNYYGQEDGLAMTGAEVDYARKIGIEVVSVFFGNEERDDVEEIYGAGYVVTCEPAEIPSRLVKIFKRIALD